MFKFVLSLVSFIQVKSFYLNLQWKTDAIYMYQYLLEWANNMLRN